MVHLFDEQSAMEKQNAESKRLAHARLPSAATFEL
jgi:hypothetical protein